MSKRAEGVSYSEEDVYGQVHPVETEEVIANGLKQLELEMTKIPQENKLSWLEAKEKCPNLTDDKHKLMFLRCEVFNADLAAIRLAFYWEKRVEIFGPTKAFLPLTLKEGALKDDAVALSFGFFRIVHGGKDPAGRSILYADSSRQDLTKYKRESMLRALWYILHSVLEENEVSMQKGLIFLYDPSRAKKFDRPQFKMCLESVRGCLPVRVSCMHLCHPPAWTAVVFPFVNLLMGERMRKRLKVHYGSQEKVLAKLAKNGLPGNVLPTDLGGDIVLDNDAWLQERRDKGL